MKQLHPKAVWLIFIKAISPIIFGLIVMIGPLTFWITDVKSWINNSEQSATITSYIPWALIIILILCIVMFIWAKLTYYFYRYELTSDGFNKESGVIWKKYTTIPYGRIQNVDIHRGVWARILGLSDIRIQTAGASAQFSSQGLQLRSSEGELVGLSHEDAKILRDELIKRSKKSNQGL